MIGGPWGGRVCSEPSASLGNGSESVVEERTAGKSSRPGIRRRRARQILRAALIVLGFVLAKETVLNLLPRETGERDLARMIRETPPPAANGAFALCVGGHEFMAALARDLADARERVALQTLSFEADPAGLALGQALLACRAPERLLIIDSFARHVISDRLLTPGNRLLDRELNAEVVATDRLVAELRADGVDVHYARPIGWRLHRLTARDHKKLVAIDDRIVYLGGINFSEHNFLWHDLMLRIEDEAAARWLREDMHSTRGGVERIASASFDGFDLHVVDGSDDSDPLGPVAALIAGARESLYLECPYITEPFHGLLAEARARGVRVTVVTSERNNRIFMRRSIETACARGDVELRFTVGAMTHVKALLVDDETLVMGSANFDYMSFGRQAEVVAVIDDPGAVAQFRERIVAPSLAASYPWRGDADGFVADISYRAIGLAEFLLRWIGR
jgi:cardiolipin synthase